MWDLDRHGHVARLGRKVGKPPPHLGQAIAGMWKILLCNDLANAVENANLMPRRAPIDASKPIDYVRGHDFPHCRARATTTPADTCTGARRRKLPIGHPSRPPD